MEVLTFCVRHPGRETTTATSLNSRPAMAARVGGIAPAQFAHSHTPVLSLSLPLSHSLLTFPLILSTHSHSHFHRGIRSIPRSVQERVLDRERRAAPDPPDPTRARTQLLRLLLRDPQLARQGLPARQAGLRRCYRRARYAVRGELQGLDGGATSVQSIRVGENELKLWNRAAHHAAPPGQPDPLDVGPQRGWCRRRCGREGSSREGDRSCSCVVVV